MEAGGPDFYRGAASWRRNERGSTGCGTKRGADPVDNVVTLCDA
jgi:hypothetical protein